MKQKCGILHVGKAPPETDLTEIFALEPMFWRQIQQHLFYDAAVTLDKIIHISGVEGGFLENTAASVFSRMELVIRATIKENGGDPMKDPYFREALPAMRKIKTFTQLREMSYDILATLEDRYYTPPDSRNKKMPRIESYIREHFRENSLCAASVADSFKISPSYLSRIFKADMKMGIVEYIHRLRIDEAKKLLRTTESPLNEIAEAVGFSNRWVFTRTFKALEGETPGAFRST